ncbi:hypothetical protein CVO77_11750 [Sphingopyxis lindanitolerans]|uniref:Uncharacterized protein n=1 Tax=Sphingopyxis lindanitolerans TaxID=2054227 RepID=A0A2S8B9H6_9SPHN|nr:hypothetical protein [Sphingopyxis lindanitolerans]PQM29062.1 hypothetical protein CVO77_11750 [Sphingopyxis lindanitolerans]
MALFEGLATDGMAFGIEIIVETGVKIAMRALAPSLRIATPPRRRTVRRDPVAGDRARWQRRPGLCARRRIGLPAPRWIRHDLDSKDPVTRFRAEESSAAMIADALGQQKPMPRSNAYSALLAVTLPATVGAALVPRPIPFAS